MHTNIICVNILLIYGGRFKKELYNKTFFLSASTVGYPFPLPAPCNGVCWRCIGRRSHPCSQACPPDSPCPSHTGQRRLKETLLWARKRHMFGMHHTLINGCQEQHSHNGPRMHVGKKNSPALMESNNLIGAGCLNEYFTLSCSEVGMWFNLCSGRYLCSFIEVISFPRGFFMLVALK